MKAEKELDRYVNKLQKFIDKGGELEQIDIDTLKTYVLEYKKELDEIYKKEELTRKELSIIYDFSDSKIYKLTADEKIPFYKNSLGHNVFIRKDIDEWLVNPNIVNEKLKEYKERFEGVEDSLENSNIVDDEVKEELEKLEDSLEKLNIVDDEVKEELEQIENSLEKIDVSYEKIEDSLEKLNIVKEEVIEKLKKYDSEIEKFQKRERRLLIGGIIILIFLILYFIFFFPTRF